MKELMFHFISHYGYLGLFLAQVLGIVGIPLPDELLMAFAGFLVSKGELRYWVTLLVAFLGSIVGMSFSYLIGHQFGLPLLEKHGRKISITPEKLAKAEQWFSRFGKLTVTLGYFIPGVRHFTALSAGISKWPYPSFLLYAFPGGLLWVLTFVTLGVFLRDHWLPFMEALRKYLWLVAIIAAIAGVAAWRVRRFFYKNKTG